MYVAISGPIAVGKTSLADFLELEYAFSVLRVRQILESMAGGAKTRTDLAQVADELEEKTSGMWLVDAVSELEHGEAEIHVAIDAVRRSSEVGALRASLQGLLHVHLVASLPVLMSRYSQRAGSQDQDLATYEQLIRHPAESELDQIEKVADLVLDTSSLSTRVVAQRLVSELQE